MKVKIDFEYTSQYVPPRCRKPRERIVQCSMWLNIKELTYDQAPMVMAFISFGQKITVVRAYKGKLYWSYQELGFVNDTRMWVNSKAEGFNWSIYIKGRKYKWLPVEGSDGSKKYPVLLTKQEVMKGIREEASHFFIVDGLVYHLETEPVYSIDSFGLCDSLGLSIGRVECIRFPGYHFSALEREACHEEIKKRLAFYRKKWDPIKTCYIKVWDKRYVSFKHEEIYS